MSPDSNPPPREGNLVTVDGQAALRFQRRYPHPIERVWRAVTEPEEMARWFPADVVGDRSVGAELRFEDDAQRAAAQDAGEPTRADGPVLRGTVLAVDPPTLFSFTWGGEILRFELRSDGADTVLTFTHVFRHQSVAARNGAGWHACLAELDALLGLPAQPADDDWRAVYDDYLDRVGPALGDATTNGTVVWERATHVDADRVRAALADPAEQAAWLGDVLDRAAAEELDWEVEPVADGTHYRVSHPHIDGDAERAARWHAALVQLDMYLAAGQVVPVDHRRWIDPYRRVL